MELVYSTGIGDTAKERMLFNATPLPFSHFFSDVPSMLFGELDTSRSRLLSRGRTPFFKECINDEIEDHLGLAVIAHVYGYRS